MMHLINGKILLSGATILAAAALVVGATFAFFSDTETSTGNTFTAGAIDLQIDNTSYALDHNIPGFQSPTGAFMANTATTWTLTDLTVEKFFNFTDLKPGDYGEDTISVHVNNNDAWLCAAARITQDTDETCTDPEQADDPTCAVPGPNQGELDQEVNFAFWKDDGDNVFETDETTFLSGPISGLGEQGQIALADTSDSGPFGDTPVPGNTTVHIGKAWCFGTLSESPATQGLSTNPVDRGTTGFTCGGSGVNNAAQTDKVVGDLQFYATQSRNNSTFTCAQNYTPTWPTPTPTPTP